MDRNLKNLLYIMYYLKISSSEYIDIYRKNNDDVGAANRFFLKNGHKKQYMQPGFNESSAAEDNSNRQYKRILHGLEKEEFKAFCIGDDDYPEQLKNIFLPPPVLFYKGNRIRHEFNIAVVGSRKCTKYGLEAAGYISRNISAMGINVVSGLAVGIDSAAHSAAVKEKGGSTAVLGNGPDIIYPPENRNLFREITENGAVITEFPPGTPPLRKNFPVRNRIISGLCRGVIIVEAGRKSGAVITGEIALRQNREVFAVPGSIFSDASRGCHMFIKSGAKLVECIEDIMEEFDNLLKFKDDDNKKYRIIHKKRYEEIEKLLEPDTKKLFDNIGYMPESVENLCLKCQMPIKKILNSLAFLEMEKLISEGPSNHYKRCD
jgi:DNA processing protein